MSMRFLKILSFAVTLAVTAAAPASTVLAAGGILAKIDCTGKTTDGRPAVVSIAVDPEATALPASATADLQLGADPAETLLITLNESSGQDVSGRTVYLFSSALDANRQFGARTFDLLTGVGALKLTGAVRAPMMNCTFVSR